MTSQNDWVWNAKHTDISSIINDYSGLKMPTCLIRRLQGWRAGVHLCTLVGPTVEGNCCFIFIPVISWRTAFIGINIFHDVISFDFYKSSFRRMLLMWCAFLHDYWKAHQRWWYRLSAVLFFSTRMLQRWTQLHFCRGSSLNSLIFAWGHFRFKFYNMQ